MRINNYLILNIQTR